MNKKGSIWSLLIVAVVALGFMAMVSFESESTGAFSAPSRPMAAPKPPMPKPPLQAPVRVVDRGPDTVVVEDDYDEVIYSDSSAVNAAIASVQVQCYAFRMEHPGQVAPEISRLCASYGVQV